MVRTQAAETDLTLQTIFEFRSNPKNPRAGLTRGSDGNFYGTTAFGGTNGENGTVFQITPAGGLTILHSFGGPDGASPWAGLAQGSDGLLYGTTQGGGTNGDFGTVFRMTTNGEFTLLHSFGALGGKSPQAALVQGSDGSFYGTTAFGGTNGDNGTVFKITPSGVFTSLLSFNGTNGRRPLASLVQGRDGNFYGTTSQGGAAYDGILSFGHGTLFQLTPNGNLTSLHSFTETDGEGPEAGLVEGSDGNFYGTTLSGGATGDNGTVFRMTPAGALTTLHSFNGQDGNYPVAILAPGGDGNLYGTTWGDRRFSGTNTFGTIFRITPEGVLTTLLSFGETNGASPVAGLVHSTDGTFYGTTFEGGAGGDGTIYRLVEPPAIAAIAASNGLLTFTWTSLTGGLYRVEYKQVLSEANWASLVPDVLATNNSSSVTHGLEGATQRFYRVRLLP
jgi:uncharacterized repeat protein (TIGR03803 family)